MFTQFFVGSTKAFSIHSVILHGKSIKHNASIIGKLFVQSIFCPQAFTINFRSGCKIMSESTVIILLDECNDKSDALNKIEVII